MKILSVSRNRNIQDLDNDFIQKNVFWKVCWYKYFTFYYYLRLTEFLLKTIIFNLTFLTFRRLDAFREFQLLCLQKDGCKLHLINGFQKELFLLSKQYFKYISFCLIGASINFRTQLILLFKISVEKIILSKVPHKIFAM